MTGRASVAVNPAGVLSSGTFSQAVLRRGTPVHLTGQVSWDDQGRVVGAGDVDAQLTQIWANIHAILAGLGATIDDVVKLVTYATDAASVAASGRERARQFEGHTPPASTFVAVSALADPGMVIEIDVVVMLSDEQLTALGA